MASSLTTCGLLDRDEERVADLALDVIGQVTLAGRVLDQDHLANADQPALAVARGDLHPGIEVDDVLPARRRVPEIRRACDSSSTGWGAAARIILTGAPATRLNVSGDMRRSLTEIAG